MIHPIPLEIGKYEILRALGGGNYSLVYHARDRALDAEKAIKVLRVNDPSLFLVSLEEAQILNRCRHKNIVTINEANILPVLGQQRVVLDLEFMPGGSVQDALSRNWLSLSTAVTYMRDALFGLEHAHLQGILHRDIKPANILLDGIAVKLSDFGLATNPGAGLIGSAQGYTPHLPPEYFTSRTTSPLTDIFAAGITLYRMVSNIRDWRGLLSSISDLNVYVEKGDLLNRLQFPSFIPNSIQRIIRRASAPDPTKRYQSVQEFRQQLDRIRFGIEWGKVSDLEWQADCSGNSHVCKVDPGTNTLTVTKNGRRVRVHCGTYGTVDEAKVAMNQHVANTTIDRLA